MRIFIAKQVVCMCDWAGKYSTSTGLENLAKNYCISSCTAWNTRKADKVVLQKIIISLDLLVLLNQVKRTIIKLLIFTTLDTNWIHCLIILIFYF